jgi:cytosine/adenosine deaminase-related metal-dependent hydrolase
VALDDDGVVTAVGRLDELSALGPVEQHPGVLLPGLVNAHLHLELSHLAGRVPGGDGLAPWIHRLLAERARLSSDPSPIASAARAAVAGMAARGTVAAADITNDGAFVHLFAAAGIEVLSLDERVAPSLPIEPARPRCVITPHAPYTCSGEAVRAIAAKSGGRVASIHVEEDPAEAQWMQSGDGPFASLLAGHPALRALAPPGLRTVPWLASLGVLGPGTLLVHLTVADEASLSLAASRGAFAVLCPRSNRHITGRLPPVEPIRAARLPVALGTDSLASSPSLDVLGELPELAAAGVEPAWLVEAATLGGARALGRPHLGALAPGRRPGLVSVGEGRIVEPLSWLAHEGAAARAERLA